VPAPKGVHGQVKE
jgi:hypothetical protein